MESFFTSKDDVLNDDVTSIGGGSGLLMSQPMFSKSWCVSLPTMSQRRIDWQSFRKARIPTWKPVIGVRLYLVTDCNRCRTVNGYFFVEAWQRHLQGNEVLQNGETFRPSVRAYIDPSVRSSSSQPGLRFIQPGSQQKQYLIIHTNHVQELVLRSCGSVDNESRGNPGVVSRRG